MLDAGSGMFRAFRHLQHDRIDILLSHAHLDHVCGLTYWLGEQIRRPELEVHLWCSATHSHVIRDRLFDRGLFPAAIRFHWHEIAAGQVAALPRATVQPLLLQHPGTAYGYRLCYGQTSIAYITDTTSDAEDEYWSAIKDCDLILHECNFRREQGELADRTGHTDLGRLADAVRRHRPRAILLTHFNPLDDDVEEAIEAERSAGGLEGTTIWVAVDGQSVSLPSG